jgi:predicted aspartyl protease
MKIPMWLLCLLLVPMLVVLRPPRAAHAEFYKYIDKEGKSNFVDDLTKIPEEYRSNYEVYPEKYDDLPAKERSTLLEIERQHVLELEDAGRRQLEEQIQRMEEVEAAERERREQEASAGLETPISVDGNQILVPVTLVNAGRKVESTFLLDTGASHIVVFRKLADQLQIAALQKGRSQIAGGQQIYSEFGRVEMFKVGPIEMPHSDVLIIAHDGPEVRFDGLLGMNFLSNVEYSVDMKNKVIRWKPQAQP